MKIEATVTKGFFFNGTSLFPSCVEIVLRASKTGDFATISLAVDEDNIMIQIPVVGDVKTILKGVVE